uniref:Putative secreted protein n=1 Tax=Anopheles darlingi TaxID=43151 RepID=A0A2M4D882_ANODA
MRGGGYLPFFYVFVFLFCSLCLWSVVSSWFRCPLTSRHGCNLRSASHAIDACDDKNRGKVNCRPVLDSVCRSVHKIPSQGGGINIQWECQIAKND